MSEKPNFLGKDGNPIVDPSIMGPIARDNRRRFVQNLRDIAGITEGVVYLNSGRVSYRYNTDVELPFRQESNFFYLTGVDLPDFQVLIRVSDGHTTLIAPHYGREVTMWSGEPPTNQELKKDYGPDDVVYEEDLDKVLKEWNTERIWTLSKDHPAADPSGLDKAGWKDKIVAGKIDWALFESRVIKSPAEIELLRMANKITGEAHIKLMKAAKSGTAPTEHEIHALFLYETHKKGSFHQAYHSICASGCHAAALHYVKNRGLLPDDPRDLVLIDAGCEYNSYGADVSRTWPIGGKYLDEWRDIYQIVYDSQIACCEATKPGIEWESIHRLADRKHVEGLKKLGILKGDVEEMLKHSVGGIFMPHGLGHLLGLDVHDVGGYPDGVPRIDEPGICNLRARRTLKPGMVLTIEPGIYFIDAFLDPALADPNLARFIDVPTLTRYRNKVGGVRIEDDIVVTETGIDNLSTPYCPTDMESIEKIMAEA